MLFDSKLMHIPRRLDGIKKHVKHTVLKIREWNIHHHRDGCFSSSEKADSSGRDSKGSGKSTAIRQVGGGGHVKEGFPGKSRAQFIRTRLCMASSAIQCQPHKEHAEERKQNGGQKAPEYIGDKKQKSACKEDGEAGGEEGRALHCRFVSFR